MKIYRSLGKRQASLLKSLREHGYWYPGCGWYWEDQCSTREILDSLVRRELAEKGEMQTGFGLVSCYRPTEERNGK